MSRVDAVAAFVMVTVTPGRTPPPASTMVPEIWPVRPCADVVDAKAAQQKNGADGLQEPCGTGSSSSNLGRILDPAGMAI